MEASQSLSIRNKIIGVLVKRARTEAGMTQKECAQFLGCTPSAFRRYEQGKKGFSLPQLESLALLFDVPVASLWDDAYPLPEKIEEEPLPLDQIMLLRRKMLAVRLRQVREAAGLSTGSLLASWRAAALSLDKLSQLNLVIARRAFCAVSAAARSPPVSEGSLSQCRP